MRTPAATSFFRARAKQPPESPNATPGHIDGTLAKDTDRCNLKEERKICVRLVFGGLTVVGDGRQDLSLDVLQGETIPGAGDDTLGDNGLCAFNKRGREREAAAEGSVRVGSQYN